MIGSLFYLHTSSTLHWRGRNPNFNPDFGQMCTQKAPAVVFFFVFFFRGKLLWLGIPSPFASHFRRSTQEIQPGYPGFPNAAGVCQGGRCQKKSQQAEGRKQARLLWESQYFTVVWMGIELMIPIVTWWWTSHEAWQKVGEFSLFFFVDQRYLYILIPMISRVN